MTSRNATPRASRLRRLVRFTTVATATGMVALLVGACSSSSTPDAGQGNASSASGQSQAPSSTGSGLAHLTVAVSQNPDTLDPAATGLLSASTIDAAIFNTLLYRFADDPKTYPGLATDYSISDDGETYTFNLRKDVTFHDGTPFDAQAVKATFDHIADPATKSQTALGALGSHYQKTVVVNKYTAKIVFDKPNRAFENVVTQPVFGISSPTAMKKWGRDYGQHPVGTGPFKFVSFQDGQNVEVQRYAKYDWGPSPLGSGPAKLSGITFRVLTDSSTQANALSTGEIQVADALTPQAMSSAVSQGMKKLTGVSNGLPEGYTIDTARQPTDDQAVRQAIISAVDQHKIVDTLFKGQYTPADSVLSPSTPGYVASPFNYDPKRAAKLLDGAGWTMGSDGIREKDGKQLTLSLIDIANFGYDQISALLQAQLKAVGFKTVITTQALPGIIETYNENKSNFADWFQTGTGPFVLGNQFRCSQVKSGLNFAHYCDEQFEENLADANSIKDPKERDAAYQKIVKSLNELALFLPIYNKANVLVANKVDGIKFGLASGPYYAGVTL